MGTANAVVSDTQWVRMPMTAGPVQNAHIEHSGIFLGVDSKGHYRFISSRSQANGPTFGDAGGTSILDGRDAYWAVRFRTARRI